MRDIQLNAPSQKSVIHCGEGVFEKYAAELPQKQLFIVTDSNVFAWYRYEMWRVMGEMTPAYIIPAGESSKSFRYLMAILREMLSKGMKRNCIVVAFGGGVVGDLAGLAASLYMRGVRFVQIPTTLLAQVDSSVGGKTAIDFDGVKNIVGSFYQPESVIVDPRFLSTLPPREIRCGLGEIIKYGALNSQIYARLLNNASNLSSPEFLEEITYMCIKHKAEVVEADEHDLTGIRQTLNLGHTTGHALELCYRKKSHGEFVLIGMYYELYIAQKLNVCGEEYAQSLKKLIKAAIKDVPGYDDISKAAELAKFDKKNTDYLVTLVVPQSEGKSAELKIPQKEYVQLLCECSQSIKEGK